MMSAERAALDRDSELKRMSDPVWQVEVDRATPTEWSQMLALFDDANLYQTWSYGAVRWGNKNLSHLVLKRDGEIVGMAQLRIIRPTRLKFGMAYLRWAPVCHRRGTELDAETVLAFARALEREYVFKRGLLLQVLPNAFADSTRAALFQSSFSNFRQELQTRANAYRTFVLDLAPTIDQLRKNLDAKWRNKLTQSEKKGLRVVSGNGVDDYGTFCRMYNEMWKRKAFETTVDIEEFGRLQADLPEAHRMRILICEQNGIPVAGVVASAIGDSAIYVLGATSDDGLNAKGAYLLQWTMVQWLKENGFKWYDLGGIDPEGNPGVYSFKRGLSGADVYQLTPFVACNSVVSSAIVRASLTARQVIRGLATLRRGRGSSQPARPVGATQSRGKAGALAEAPAESKKLASLGQRTF
jgi:lipid II:glycine glycyltransferase (peptidoglycan interpeptide bridge formation enzyme)